MLCFTFRFVEAIGIGLHGGIPDLRANRASRKKSELGVMMLDIDHFKQCNDAFGYEVGDSVLRSLGTSPERYSGPKISCTAAVARTSQ